MRYLRIECLILFILYFNNLFAQEVDKLFELQQEAAKVKNIRGYSDVCDYLCTMEIEPDMILTYADSICQLAIRDKSLEGFVEYYSWRGEALFMKGDTSKGAIWMRKAIVLAEKVKEFRDVCILSSRMGYLYNVAARYDSARYYFKQGMRLAEKIPGYDDRYRLMLTNYVSSFLFEGKTDSALVYALQAKEHSRVAKDTAMLVENLNQLGVIYRRKKKLDACVSCFEQSIHWCEAMGNYRTVVYIYGNIATVYCEWKRPNDAIPFSKKALEYALKLEEPQLIGICYVNLGAIKCNVKGEESEAIELLQKAVPIFQETSNKRRLCEAYCHITNAFRKLGQIDSAMVYLQKVDKLSEDLKTNVERFRYYKIKAPLLKAKGQLAEAVNCYNQVLEFIRAGLFETEDYEVYKELAECLHALRDNTSAYEKLRTAYSLRDSAFHKENLEKLSDYSVKYQTKEKELEIARLRQNELERETKLLYRRIAFVSILALLIIFLLGLLYARQRQKARLAKLAQAAGEKERQFLALQKETEHRLTRKYIDGLESERERMATELHDDVCNNLLALEMNIRSLNAENDAMKDKQLGGLQEIRERLRNISHELMPPAFQYATIDEMLADYISHLVLPGNMRAEYSSTKGVDWKLMPQEIGFEFYRIVQEAVNNAVKYSEATHIQVKLLLEEDWLSVLIADNGKGFVPNRKTEGIGLRTIWQRTNIIGGTIELDAVPGQGVSIKVSVRI